MNPLTNLCSTAAYHPSLVSMTFQFTLYAGNATERNDKSIQTKFEFNHGLFEHTFLGKRSIGQRFFLTEKAGVQYEDHVPCRKTNVWLPLSVPCDQVGVDYLCLAFESKWGADEESDVHTRFRAYIHDGEATADYFALAVEDMLTFLTEGLVPAHGNKTRDYFLTNGLENFKGVHLNLP